MAIAKSISLRRIAVVLSKALALVLIVSIPVVTGAFPSMSFDSALKSGCGEGVGGWGVGGVGF